MQRRRLLILTALYALLASNLPALQRAPAACDQFQAALRADSTNLDAAVRLGQCSFRDYEMIAPDGDSTRLAFRSSWSAALRALRRAVDLDPRYSRAYRPLFAILFAETRDGCSFVTSQCRFVSPVLRQGDSVVTVPRPVRLDVQNGDTYDDVLRETSATRRDNLVEARRHAERWAGVAPDDRLPHQYLGRALLRLGDAPAAVVELERGAALGTPASRRALFWDRFEALVKSDRGADARRLLDEAVADPGRDTIRLRSFTIMTLNALVGRHRPPPVDSAQLQRQRARLEAIIRSQPPIAEKRERGFAGLVASGDSAAARRQLAYMDSMITLTRGTPRFPRVGPEHLQSARYHLILGDTAGAEARLAEIEQPFDSDHFEFAVSAYGTATAWLGEAWLLAGDVLAARGRRSDATRRYRRVVGLWDGGDAEHSTVVELARARLTARSAR